ncbi:MAG: GFA family protein [Pseudomonadota bacterium]
MGTLKGQCLCERVRFSAEGEIRRISACYCSQCTRQNGGGPFYGVELEGSLTVEQGEALRWYDSSSKAKRGFCAHCGSSVFWQANDNPSLFDVSIGALNNTEQLRLDAHIFVDHCPSYLAVPDTAPHFTEADVLS